MCGMHIIVAQIGRWPLPNKAAKTAIHLCSGMLRSKNLMPRVCEWNDQRLFPWWWSEHFFSPPSWSVQILALRNNRCIFALHSSLLDVAPKQGCAAPGHHANLMADWRNAGNVEDRRLISWQLIKSLKAVYTRVNSGSPFNLGTIPLFSRRRTIVCIDTRHWNRHCSGYLALWLHARDVSLIAMVNDMILTPIRSFGENQGT